MRVLNKTNSLELCLSMGPTKTSTWSINTSAWTQILLRHKLYFCTLVRSTVNIDWNHKARQFIRISITNIQQQLGWNKLDLKPTCFSLRYCAYHYSEAMQWLDPIAVKLINSAVTIRMSFCWCLQCCLKSVVYP